MTIKRFNNGRIIINYDKYLVFISDSYNDFMFTMDSNMKKYFVPYIERLSKICELYKNESIPTHPYPHSNKGIELLCSEISKCYRGRHIFAGNYMNIDRKNTIISAFKECFKRVKEEDIELIDLDLRSFDLKSLLHIKRGLL